MNDIVNRNNLSDQVAAYLRNYISSHGLKIGDSLPSEMEVCDELGVSRGIVREAFRSLAAIGVIEVTSGKRARVHRLHDEVLAQLFDHAIRTDQITPAQVLEMRRVIETGAARLAAERRTPEDVEALIRAVQGMQDALPQNIDRYVAHDVQFHTDVARATHNPLFVFLVSSLRQSLADSIRAGLQGRTRDEQLRHIQDLHVAILEAITRGDPDSAMSTMGLHFDDALAAVSRQPAGDPARYDVEHESLAQEA